MMEVETCLYSCYCTLCKGAKAEHHTWKRHRKKLENQQAALQFVIGQVHAPDDAAPLPSPPPFPTSDHHDLDSLSDYEIQRAQILEIYGEVEKLKRRYPTLPKQLVFCRKPLTGADDIECPPLDPTKSSSQSFQHAERTALQLIQRITQTPDTEEEWLNHAKTKIVLLLDNFAQELRHHKSSLWQEEVLRSQNAEKIGEAPVICTKRYFEGERKCRNMLHIACWLVIVVNHLWFGATRLQSSFLLRAIEAIVVLGMNTLAHTGETIANRVGTSYPFKLPYDLRTAMSYFQVETVTETYVCCPKCSKLYSIIDGQFPTFCDFNYLPKETGQAASVCGARLGKQERLQGGRYVFKPSRGFDYQSVKQFIGRMMARQGFEDLVDSLPREKLAEPLPETATDIWDGQFLRTFHWKDGTSFWSSPPSEGRLIFSLAIDWFNAHHGGPAGKLWSVGSIFLVCLNLPPHLRFRPENICLVGIIPGPKKVSGDEVNHFLQLIVRDFLELWHTGVWYTETRKYPFGRLVRAALGPVICDMEACRNIGGYVSFSHTNFCSYCKLKIQDIATYFDPHTFPPRTYPEHCGQAIQWLSCETEKDRERWEAFSGVKWTALLLLPYWDPIRCMVVDVMHNQFLGNLKRHCQVVWGMSVSVEGSDGSKVVLKHVPSPAEMVRGRYVLRHGSLKALKALYSRIVAGLCFENGLISEIGGNKSKDTMVAALDKFRHDNSIYIPEIPQNEGDRLIEDQATLKATERSQWHTLPKGTLIRLHNHYSTSNADFISDPSSVTANVVASRLKHILVEIPPDDPLIQDLSSKEKKDAQVVLGAPIMAAIRHDINRTVLPSWMPKVGQHLGSTWHGKLSANEWRTASSVHMVITLIHSWGFGNPYDRQQQMLDNYIHLVLATMFSSRRSTSMQRRQQVTHHMNRYLNSLQKLYPRAAITPNHHTALHLESFLADYGPPQSWWAFPFERFNGILQGTKTNSIFDRLEHTMMAHFCRKSNIMALIAGQTLPKGLSSFYDRIRPILEYYCHSTPMVDHDYEGWSARPNSVKSPLVKLDESEARLLRQHSLIKSRVRDCRSVSYRGASFIPLDTRERDDWLSGRDSSIIYRLPGENNTGIGRILRIFQTSSNNVPVEECTYMIVQPYQELTENDAGRDPYRKYPELECRLVYNAVEEKLVLVRLCAVVGHVARCPLPPRPDGNEHFQTACLVMLSLDRS